MSTRKVDAARAQIRDAEAAAARRAAAPLLPSKKLDIKAIEARRASKKKQAKNGFKPGHVSAANTGTWKKGQSGNPQGRRVEAKKLSALTEAQRVDMANRYGITPLEFMLSIIRDDELSLDFRLDAASMAAPYMHYKMPTRVEGPNGTPLGFYSADQLAKLSDEQLEQLHKAVAVLSLIGSPSPVPMPALIDVTPTKTNGNGSTT